MTNEKNSDIIQTKVYKKDVIFMENIKDIAPINEDLNVEIYEVEEIKQKIYTIRGKQVILDSDIARLYEVETKRVNEAVKRNAKRFPVEFCFQLTEEECDNLRSQFATSKQNNPNMRSQFATASRSN